MQASLASPTTPQGRRRNGDGATPQKVARLAPGSGTFPLSDELEEVMKNTLEQEDVDAPMEPRTQDNIFVPRAAGGAGAMPTAPPATPAGPTAAPPAATQGNGSHDVGHTAAAAPSQPELTMQDLASLIRAENTSLKAKLGNRLTRIEHRCDTRRPRSRPLRTRSPNGRSRNLRQRRTPPPVPPAQPVRRCA